MPVNLLANPDFGAPPLPPTLLIGADHNEPSAAPSWGTWSNPIGPPVCLCFHGRHQAKHD